MTDLYLRKPEEVESGVAMNKERTDHSGQKRIQR